MLLGGPVIYLANGGVVTNGASGGTASAAYILGYNSASSSERQAPAP